MKFGIFWYFIIPVLVFCLMQWHSGVLMVLFRFFGESAVSNMQAHAQNPGPEPLYMFLNGSG